MRYDAAIIGAGVEGLAAAVLLGQAGLRVRLIERHGDVGGRVVAREFHPGFRASPFVDDMAPIPAEIFWTLDLARHGAIFTPQRYSLAQWQGRRHVLNLSRNGSSALCLLLARSARRRDDCVRRLLDDAAKRGRDAKHVKSAEAPRMDWAMLSLAGALAAASQNPDEAAHAAAYALGGRACDPHLDGSALHLLSAGAGYARLAGGVGRLGEALRAAAAAVGVEFALGLEASDIHCRDGRIVSVGLADGSEIPARAVLSTLDVKRTFLTFFPWNALPGPVVRRVNNFRMAGAMARVLFAVRLRSDWGRPDAPSAPIHVAPDLDVLSDAYQSWRTGIIAKQLPVTLRLLSDGNPYLAPPAHAVVTATLSPVPFSLFDGAWTFEKREALRQRALDAAGAVFPGFADEVLASEVVAPPDFEDALGVTQGDLSGGEIAPDQLPGTGLWGSPSTPRTPIKGLYLAGSNLAATAFATCASGAAAARALLADLADGKIR